MMIKKGKKILLYAMLLATFVLTCVVLFACNIDNVKEISVTPDTIDVRMGEFNYSDYTVTATFDSGKTEQSTLSADMLEAKDRILLFQEGEHVLTVYFKDKTTTINVNVRRNVFAGAEFNDVDIVYDGEFHTVEVKNVPEGTTVTYPTTNRFRTAGTYQATAILRKDAYEMKEMTANVVIRKATYDLSQINFENKEEVYDGDIHEISIDGTLPTGLYVDYTITKFGGREEPGNSAKNAGIYTIQASFSGDNVNYNVVEPKIATLRIKQAEIDVSDLSFDSKWVQYDRTVQKIELEGNLPLGVSVTYINNEHVDVGVYNATAKFDIDDIVNYEPIPNMYATLTIEKAEYDMSGVQFNGTKTSYDGTEKTIEIEGTLPMGLSVSYSGNVAKNAGTYVATASFESNNPNFKNPASMTATIIIDPIPAKMDMITFERRRFISQRNIKDDFPPEYWNYIFQHSEEQSAEERANYLKVFYFDPYRAANEYRPQNIPDGLKVKDVKYKKVDGWIDDLSSFDGEGEGYGKKILEDGYYVVVIEFDGSGNYTGLTKVNTLIRASTVNSFTNWDLKVFDDDWVNPETGRASGAFMDYYEGACSEYRDVFTFGDITIQYCDCSIFLKYSEEGVSALSPAYDTYITQAKREDYHTLAEKYNEFRFHRTVNINSGGYYYSVPDNYYQPLLDAADEALRPTNGEDVPWTFNLNDVAFVILEDTVYNGYMSKHTDHTQAEYIEVLAHIFGFENVSDFFGEDKATNKLMEACVARMNDSSSGLSMDSATGQLAFSGAIYDKNGNNSVLMFPYTFSWIDIDDNQRTEAMIIFCSYMYTGSFYISDFGVLISDVDSLFEIFNAPAQAIIVEGRCINTETLLTRLCPTVKVTDESGTDVSHVVTSDKDLTFLEESAATEKLTQGTREVYRFVENLPGNCAEESESYDLAEHQISTNQATYTFCDDDIFAKIIKANGDSISLTNRTDRDEHPQMEAGVAENLDYVTELYNLFISNYAIGEDVVNEWRLGVTNRYYNLYKDFFEFTSNLMALAGRNLGKNNEYVLSESVIIGMNNPFTISINNSGNDYTLDQYRMIVAKLFGFNDLATFTSYTNTLAQELAQNKKNANVESVSARLIYDGAIYTTNGYFILPFVIRTELSLQKVFALVFVDTVGNMSVWINDARNAFNATNFGDAVLSSGDKYEVTIYGRCLLAEDDGYIMREDLDSKIAELIKDLQNASHNIFSVTYPNVSCKDTNENEQYGEYTIFRENACYLICDCYPLGGIVYANGEYCSITKRIDRNDIAVMADEVVARFDSLSDLYHTFFSNYSIEENGSNYWEIGQGNDNYLDYRRFFKQAGNLYAIANNDLGYTSEYLLTNSAVIGLNKSFAIAGTGNDHTVDEYRQMIANLLGFDDVATLTTYANMMANAFMDNERSANTDTVENRLIYDGAIYTTNGIYVLPYVIRRKAKDNILTYMFVDTDGTISIWINNINVAFDTIDFTGYGPESREHVYINGRCVLFEENDYIGWNDTKINKNIAVEKVKAIGSSGDFLIYTPFIDEEGFEVYWFSVYDYELKVVYEDDNTYEIGTVQRGCYTLLNIASKEDVRISNDNRIYYAEQGGYDEWH